MQLSLAWEAATCADTQELPIRATCPAHLIVLDFIILIIVAKSASNEYTLNV
jgi:hypothetical protein